MGSAPVARPLLLLLVFILLAGPRLRCGFFELLLLLAILLAIVLLFVSVCLLLLQVGWPRCGQQGLEVRIPQRCLTRPGITHGDSTVSASTGLHAGNADKQVSEFLGLCVLVTIDIQS